MRNTCTRASLNPLGNTDFTAFVTEFYRLSTPLRRDENSLLNSFRRKLSPTMQHHIISRQNESLDDLIEICRRVDDDLKLQQRSRRNAAYAPFSRPSTLTATPTTPPSHLTKTTLDPNAFVHSSMPRTKMSAAEHEHLKA